MNANNLKNAENIINGMNNNIKYIKKEKGLIEKRNIEDDKVILMEDNRQILLG